MNSKRLHRSSTDKAIAGVCGGIAEYFDIDSVIIRLLFVLLALGLGSGLLIYIVCAIVIPSEEQLAKRGFVPGDPEFSYEDKTQASGTRYYSTEDNSSYDDTSYQYRAANGYSSGSYGSYTQPEAQPEHHKKSGNRTLGIIAILIGAAVIANEIIPKLSPAFTIGGVVLIIGIYLVAKKN